MRLYADYSAVPICFHQTAPGPVLETAWDFHKAWYFSHLALTTDGLYGYLW